MVVTSALTRCLLELCHCPTSPHAGDSMGITSPAKNWAGAGPLYPREALGPLSTQLPAKPLAPARSQQSSAFCPAARLSSLGSNSPRLFGSHCRLELGPRAGAAYAQGPLVCCRSLAFPLLAHPSPAVAIIPISHAPPCCGLHHRPPSFPLCGGGISTAPCVGTPDGPPPWGLGHLGWNCLLGVGYCQILVSEAVAPCMP